MDIISLRQTRLWGWNQKLFILPGLQPADNSWITFLKFDWLGSVTNQQLIMEEVLERFPHLGENIFQKLDSECLIKCKEVNRTFKNFMKAEKLSYLHAIQWYTNCSEPLMRKVVKKSGAAIIILSILREIFGNFIRGTKL